MSADKIPTLLDVAERAGVSKSTVSRVLNDHRYVSPASRESVLQAVMELGYRPNSFARSLRTQRSLTVGFVVPSLRNDVYAALAEGASKVLEPTNRTLLVSISGNDARLEFNAIQHLIARNVEGLILTLADERSREVVRLLRESATPIVLVDRDVPSVSGADRIMVDQTSVTDAARNLEALGHTRVALLTPPEAIRPGREVTRAFREVYSDAEVIHGPLEFEHGRSAVESLLASKDPPTALLVAGTQVFAGAMKAIRDAGLAIPEDISIIGYDESVFSQLVSPGIDTITRDILGIGTLAGQLLLSRLDEGRTDPVEVSIATRYIKRYSVGSPVAIS